MGKTSLPESLLTHAPWEKEFNPIWLATSFTLHRNLAKHNFPPKLSEQLATQTLQILQEQMKKSPDFAEQTFLKAEELSPLDKQYLFEHFLCLEGFQNTLGGQGFVVEKTGRLFAALNVEEHLQIQLIDREGEWENGWNTLNRIEIDLNQGLEFAFSPKFGYLTSDPGHCGTGLVIKAYLHLPALIQTKQLPEILLKQKEEGISVTGMKGNLEEIVGNLVVLSNTFTLGLTEESLLRGVDSMAIKLMALKDSPR